MEAPGPIQGPIQSPYVPLESTPAKKQGPVKNALAAAAEARLQRFVAAYVETGGNKTESAIQAGVWAKDRRTAASAGASLYNKAVARGLLKDTYIEAVEEPLSKENILTMLTEMASAKRPASRVVTSRRDKNGYMRETEVKVSYDALTAQQMIAKILGLYSDAPKAPQVNILQVIGKLPEKERAIAEAEIIEVQGKILELPTKEQHEAN